MNKEDHVKYINDLTKLQDEEGKRISALALGIMEKLLKSSKGNPARFAAVVGAVKKSVVIALVAATKASQSKARNLGIWFGKQKKNDRPH